MKKFTNVLSIIALIAVIGLQAAACKDESSDVEKTLVITGIPKTEYDSWMAAPYAGIDVVPNGLDPTDPDSMSKKPASVDLKSANVKKEGNDPVKLTIQLSKDGKPMTESGTFDIYVVLFSGTDFGGYWLPDENISSAITTVEFSKFTKD